MPAQLQPGVPALQALAIRLAVDVAWATQAFNTLMKRLWAAATQVQHLETVGWGTVLLPAAKSPRKA